MPTGSQVRACAVWPITSKLWLRLGSTTLRKLPHFSMPCFFLYKNGQKGVVAE